MHAAVEPPLHGEVSEVCELAVSSVMADFSVDDSCSGSLEFQGARSLRHVSIAGSIGEANRTSRASAQALTVIQGLLVVLLACDGPPSLVLGSFCTDPPLSAVNAAP